MGLTSESAVATFNDLGLTAVSASATFDDSGLTNESEMETIYDSGMTGAITTCNHSRLAKSESAMAAIDDSGLEPVSIQQSELT
jgi:hypothetical protein